MLPSLVEGIGQVQVNGGQSSAGSHFLHTCRGKPHLPTPLVRDMVSILHAACWAAGKSPIAKDAKGV